MSLALRTYRLVTDLLAPLAWPVMLFRAMRGKEDLSRIRERFGFRNGTRETGRVHVWLHGVSVGECLSLLPLAEAIIVHNPYLIPLVTYGTRTAAQLVAQRLPAGAIHRYVPIDTYGAVNRFLHKWHPTVVILVESEIWPNLIQEVRRWEIPLALISARMTPSSAKGWARVPQAARTLLQSFQLILPQDPDTAARLTALGATVGPYFNLKRLGQPLDCDPAQLADLKARTAGRFVVLASNTHTGEDALIAQAALGLDALLIIAPRHPERGPFVAADLIARGHIVALRSAGQSLTPATTAYIADTLGEMGLFYRLADVAVMGGSFLPGIGGHNPLEPARLCVPVVAGPHVFNAQALYDEMYDEVCAIPAKDAVDLRRHLIGMMTYPHIRSQMRDAALRYAARQGASLKTAMDLLEPLLPERSTASPWPQG